jgi:hypothetical protein
LTLGVLLKLLVETVAIGISVLGGKPNTPLLFIGVVLAVAGFVASGFAIDIALASMFSNL